MDNEDLTASVWDDVLSPSSEPQYGPLSGSVVSPSVHSHFNNLSVEDHEEKEKEEDQAQSEPQMEFHQSQHLYEPQSSHNDPFSSTYYSDHHDSHDFNISREQISELKKDERKEHTNQLLSELTQGSEEGLLAGSGTVSPKQVTPSESLFNDKDSPLKVNKNIDAELLASPKGKVKLKNGQLFKAPRPRKFASKVNVKHLENKKSDPVVVEKNPLGPLGSESDDAKSGDKSSIISSNKAEILARQADAPLYEIQKKSEEDKLREEDPHDESLNQLEITVGDPMKVGDITTAHIVYAIRTKNKNPSTTSLPNTTEYVTVSRRYKDFRWIYHQLQNNHPGKIIPPPPTKQTYIGRFNENFIENRRLSLEKMLNKISNIPVLSNDPDFIMFLISEDFINESRERERLSGSGASQQNNDFLDNNGLNDDTSSSTGSLNSSSTISAPLIAGGGSGFMSSLFSMSTKIDEPDEYFSHKKQYIDELEYNLKQFYKAIELVGTQRLEMIGILDELSLTIDELASLEISKVTTELLSAFSEIQLKIKDNLDRINLQDQLTLGFTIEEYLRILGSIKFIFETRSKIYQQYYTFNQELLKKSLSLDKLSKKYKAQVDKINSLTFEVDKLKQKTAVYEKNFNTISDTIKSEIENFEFEKIEDFRNSVEIFIESSIESQKEAIELYETFYERQNLATV
ncbi:Vps5 C terminal like-domain-containing protein [Scheffersomyces xylosifermentans]|uniref:Vps5 C terminal like-domain-containing protein n=1 Tax=Scheffersomyces xylosifermentans TaxID=1304137 RepID=UPI00315CF3D1